MTTKVFGEYVGVRQRAEGPICDGRAVERRLWFLKRSEARNVTEDTTRYLTGIKMRLPFHISASQVNLLFLALLCPIRHGASHLPSSAAFFPTLDRRELETSLYDLKAPLQDHKDPEMWSDWFQDSPQTPLEPEEEDEPWEEEQLLRGQRGDIMDLPISQFPGDNSLEAMNYQEGGEGEEGWKRNDALTSMAGGLQAVSREKGGFGFRFGRKRWLEKRRDGGVIQSRKRGFTWTK